MSTVQGVRREEYELLARIARWYYMDDRTQEDIARAFHLSRSTVQRLLVRARQEGVVEIQIVSPPRLRLALESELCRVLGLSEAIVSTGGSSSEGAAARCPDQSQRDLPGAR